MSDFGDDTFIPPAFKPDEALPALKRQLRDLRPLAERGAFFELQGKPVVQLVVEDGALQARLAKRPAATPQWEPRALKGSADVRKFVDEVKKRLASWQDDER